MPLHPSTPSTSTAVAKISTTEESTGSTSTNITIIQVSSPLHVSVTRTQSSSTNTVKDVFNFTPSSTVEKADDSFKSNVQIIPSSYSPSPLHTIPSASHYPVAKARTNLLSDQQVTTVQVSGATSLATGYGKIIKSSTISTSGDTAVTPTQPSKFSQNSSNAGVAQQSDAQSHRNFGAITNIPIGSTADTSSSSSTVQLHYEQVFVTPSASSVSVPSTSTHNRIVVANSPKQKLTKSVASQAEVHINRINLQKDTNNHRNKENNAPDIASSTTEAVTLNASSSATVDMAIPSTSAEAAKHTIKLRNNQNSSNTGKIVTAMRENLPSPLPAIRKLLTRGLTEATITRPSRRELNTVSNRGRSKNTVGFLFNTKLFPFLPYWACRTTVIWKHKLQPTKSLHKMNRVNIDAEVLHIRILRAAVRVQPTQTQPRRVSVTRDVCSRHRNHFVLVKRLLDLPEVD